MISRPFDKLTTNQARAAVSLLGSLQRALGSRKQVDISGHMTQTSFSFIIFIICSSKPRRTKKMSPHQRTSPHDIASPHHRANPHQWESSTQR